MTEKIEKAEFVKSLERVSPALGTNVLVPAFQCFIFSKGHVTVTDGVMVIRTKCVGGGEDLDCTVPGPQFLGLLKGMGGKTISVEEVDDNVVVKSARGSIKGTFATVAKTDPLEVPKCEMFTSDDNYKRLLDGLNFCRYSVSKDETTGPRCGVRVEGNKVYSTDKYRIARYDIKKEQIPGSITIPLKFVNVLLKYKKEIRMMGIYMDIHLVVQLEDDTVLFSTLLEGEYKSLEGFFPSDDAKFTKIAFPEDLNPVLERHIAFLKDIDPMAKVMNVTIGGKNCSFVSIDKDLGKLEEDLELAEEVKANLVFPINPLFWRDVTLRCSEFYYTGTEEEDNELILFMTDDLSYLCRPDRRPGDKK